MQKNSHFSFENNEKYSPDKNIYLYIFDFFEGSKRIPTFIYIYNYIYIYYEYIVQILIGGQNTNSKNISIWVTTIYNPTSSHSIKNIMFGIPIGLKWKLMPRSSSYAESVVPWVSASHL